MAELHTRAVRAGEQIFAEGDIADCAYVIEFGEIEIHARLGETSRCVAVIGGGALLGEMAILDDTTRSATAIARTDALMTVIERSQLALRMQSADPVIRLILSVFLNRQREQLHRSPTQSSNQVGLIDRNEAIDRIKLENELKAGIEAGEMQLYVQPMADFRNRKIAGFETLVRWMHPERGMVRPDHFISVAEESGLIVTLGRWILRTACEYLLRFEKESNSAGLQHRGGFMSVNVSTGQFADPEFIPALAAILQETGINPRHLKLEITESVLTDVVKAKKWINEVKQLGVRVALDDFGTGYSSLSYLHEFALDTLKIDQSFVRRMNQDHRCERIVGAIVTIAQALDLEIIAEGIETEEQYQRLQTLGCHYAQGYLISRPVPAEGFFL